MNSIKLLIGSPWFIFKLRHWKPFNHQKIRLDGRTMRGNLYNFKGNKYSQKCLYEELKLRKCSVWEFMNLMRMPEKFKNIWCISLFDKRYRIGHVVWRDMWPTIFEVLPKLRAMTDRTMMGQIVKGYGGHINDGLICSTVIWSSLRAQYPL